MAVAPIRRKSRRPGARRVYQAFAWDPTEPVATRPLMLQVPDWGSTLFYAHDGNKNVSEVFYYALGNGIAAHYDYAPFGAVARTAKATSVARDILSENPFRFSSEVHDNSLGLVYYNYRHYNPKDGRWLGRDPLEEEDTIVNLYLALRNNPSLYDLLGMVLPTLGGPSAMQDSITYDPSRPPPPPPETWETWIPVYGSIRGMDYAFYNGHYVQGTFELGMTLADMALVEQIVLGLGNGCWKIGSHTWSATRKWYGRLRDLPKGTHVHHQFIHRNGPVGKHIPDWIKNQPWNLNPIYSRSIRGRPLKSFQLHSIIHGASTEVQITVFDLWNVQYSTGAKAFQIFTSLHVIETIMFEKEDDADAVYLNGKRLE